jgi:hypothetical protein
VLRYGSLYWWKIVASNNLGSTVGPVWSFRTRQAPPDPPEVPQNPDPANNGTGVSVNPTLTWSGILGTEFDVYFGTSSSPGRVSRYQTELSYTPTGPLLYYTRYYWYVVAFNPDGARTSPLWSFVTELAPATNPELPNTPVPSNNGSGVGQAVTLAWRSIGATSYDVYIGTTAAVSDWSSLGWTSTSYLLAGPLTYATTYYWKIVAINAYGTTPGPVWSFTTIAAPLPVPLEPSSPSPADNTTGVTPTPTLRWSSIYSTSANIYFGTVEEEWPPLVVTNHPTTSWAPPALIALATYWWRIKAKNATGVADGALWSFTVQDAAVTPPAVPTSPSPARGVTNVALAVVLRWVSARAASYTLYFGKTPEPPQFLTGITASEHDLGTLVPNTTYYWRIVAINTGGNTEGAVWYFTTINTTPPDPYGPTPANGATDVDTRTKLSWAAVNFADWYDVYLGTSSSPGRVARYHSETQFQPDTLSPATRYYWYIEAGNADGSTTGPIWSFQTAGTVPVDLPTQPVGHLIHRDRTTFRTASDAIWHWRGVTYFGMLADYIGHNGRSLPSGLYAWASALGANVFRVLLMKSPLAAMPFSAGAGFKPSDYSDAQLNNFLSAVQAEGFYVELCAIQDVMRDGWDAGVSTVALQQAFLDRIAAVCRYHPHVFLEAGNEPYNNNFDPMNMVPPSGVWLARGAGTDGAPYQPPWHYLTDHPPRTDGDWARKAKNILEYTRLGWGGYSAFNIPGVNDEPMGIAEVAVPGRRTTDPQMCADFYAVAELFGCGSTILADALSHSGELPGATAQACCEAIAESWASIPANALLGTYKDGGNNNLPIEHDDAFAVRTYGMAFEHEATCVVVGKKSGWTAIAREGWEIVSVSGYGDNIVKLTKP